MIAWWLIIIVLGVNGIGLVASLWFIYHFCHGDDLKYNQGIFAQVVAILGFQIFYLAFALVCYDSYNYVFDGGFDMSYFWKLIYLAIIIYLTVILPIAVFYYQADSDPRIAKRSPLFQTFKGSSIAIVCCWALIGLLYAFSHEIALPDEQCLATGADSCNTTEVTVDFLFYLIGLPGYFGWFVLMLVGGIGTPALPINLFYKWLYRPKPLSANEYEDMKKVLGERATALRQVGEALKTKEAELYRNKGYSLKAPAHRMKFKNKVSRFKEVVAILGEEHKRLEQRKTSHIRSPLKTMCFFLGAMLSLTCSLALIAQVLLSTLIPQMTKTDPISGIGALLSALQKSHSMLPEFAVYTLIYGHEILCAVYGLIKLNAKLKGCLPVEPLRAHQTHLNAILFHTSIMMLTGCAVISMSVTTLPSFVQGTEAEIISTIQTDYMKLYQVMARKHVFEWIWFVVTILSFIWFAIWPNAKPPMNLNDPKVVAKWAKLNKKLGIDEDAEGGISPEQEPQDNDEGAEPLQGFAKLKDKMLRFDQTVADAPGAIMGAAVKKPWQ